MPLNKNKPIDTTNMKGSPKVKDSVGTGGKKDGNPINLGVDAFATQTKKVWDRAKNAASKFGNF